MHENRFDFLMADQKKRHINFQEADILILPSFIFESFFMFHLHFSVDKHRSYFLFNIPHFWIFLAFDLFGLIFFFFMIVFSIFQSDCLQKFTFVVSEDNLFDIFCKMLLSSSFFP